ncbi:unnamed protein product [Pedinophyceae sp. YPF-701]|nr:unnamed protein product [Pedinophyceae sp. YPF-701]
MLSDLNIKSRRGRDALRQRRSCALKPSAPPPAHRPLRARPQAIKARGKWALLRVPSDERASIKKALDLGPDALIVPLISTVDAADALVASVRYPHDLGARGVAYPLIRASGWGTDPKYLSEYRERTLLLPQIEDQCGVQNANEILGVDGIDGVFIGPLDLSSSLGLPGDLANQRVQDAIAALEQSAKDCNKLLCGYAPPQSPAGGAAKPGYAMVACAADMALLRDAAVANARAAHAARGD